MSIETVSSASWAQKFAQNAENQLKSGSTYVVAVGLGFFALLAAWPDLAKAVDAIPLLHGYGAGIAVLITTLVTKFRPSNAMSSQLQTALIELARTKANALLKANGSTLEIPPAPAASTLPVVPISAVIAHALPPDPVNRATAPPPPVPAWADTQSAPEFGAVNIPPAPPPIVVSSLAPAPAPAPIDPRNATSLTATDPLDIELPISTPAPTPSPSPAQPTLPIDPKLLLSLVHQYLTQQVASK